MSNRITATAILLATGLLIIICCSSCVQGTNSHANARDYIQTRSVYAGTPLAIPPLLQTDTIKERTRDIGKTPPTGKQVFGLWIGRFSAFALIVLGLLIFLCPSAVALFFVNKARQFKNAFTETVAAIHHSDAITRDTRLHDALVLSQTPQTRDMVQVAKKDA